MRRILAVTTALVVVLVGTGAGATAASSRLDDDPLRSASASRLVRGGFVDAADGVRHLHTADGRWVVELDEVARRMTVTSPTGEVERFGPESSIWTDAIPAVKAPSTQVLGGHAAVTANSTACAWAVWFIGVIHTSSWAYAVGMLALNPPAAAALTVIVTLGYGAFWNWVSMQC